MKIFLPLVTVSLLSAKCINAHYIFQHLLLNGKQTEQWQYIRDVGNDDPTWEGWKGYPENGFGKVIPLTRLNHSEFVCGREAFKSAPKTHIADVLAGEEIGFRIALNIAGGFPTMSHWGILQAYMSKALKGDILNYSGIDEDWFKIAYLGPVNKTNMSHLFNTEYNFTIPKTTPPGQYLVRVESIIFGNIRTEPDQYSIAPQYYVNCAQVNVIGEGGGIPGPSIKFPGTYRDNDPGIIVPGRMMDNDVWGVAEDLTGYSPPGPPVWVG